MFFVVYEKRFFYSNGHLVLNQEIIKAKKKSHSYEDSLSKSNGNILHTSSFPVPDPGFWARERVQLMCI